MKKLPSIGEKVRINFSPDEKNTTLNFTNGQDVYVNGIYGKNYLYVNSEPDKKTISLGTEMIHINHVLTMQQIHLSDIFNDV